MIFDENHAKIRPFNAEGDRSTESTEFPGACKGICNNYRAVKPLFTGRYAANQVRCQICEIFLTSDGIELRNGAPYCRCCHYRVRTRPRNSYYKEKFQEQISGNTEQTPIRKESESNEIQHQSDQQKKTTPIYQKIKRYSKSYYELKEFIENDIKPQLIISLLC